MDLLARVVVLGCCLVGLAACGAGPAAEPPSTAEAATTAAPAATTGTSTSGAPTTTLSPRERDEAEIREIHDQFFRMVERTHASPDPADPEIAAVTTGIQEQRSEDRARSLIASAQHVGGSIQSKVIDIRFVDVDHATLQTCTLSHGQAVDAEGRIVATDPTEPFVTGLLVQRTADGWRVADWLTGGREPCEY